MTPNSSRMRHINVFVIFRQVMTDNTPLHKPGLLLLAQFQFASVKARCTPPISRNRTTSCSFAPDCRRKWKLTSVRQGNETCLMSLLVACRRLRSHMMTLTGLVTTRIRVASWKQNKCVKRNKNGYSACGKFWRSRTTPHDQVSFRIVWLFVRFAATASKKYGLSRSVNLMSVTKKGAFDQMEKHYHKTAISTRSR
jgi:hypothetical protein